jgi:hypothetical protein
MVRGESSFFPERSWNFTLFKVGIDSPYLKIGVDEFYTCWMSGENGVVLILRTK